MTMCSFRGRVTFLSYNRHSAVEGRVKCPIIIVWKCIKAMHVQGVGGLSGRHLLSVLTDEVHPVHHGGDGSIREKFYCVKNNRCNVQIWVP